MRLLGCLRRCCQRGREEHRLVVGVRDDQQQHGMAIDIMIMTMTMITMMMTMIVAGDYSNADTPERKQRKQMAEPRHRRAAMPAETGGRGKKKRVGGKGGRSVATEPIIIAINHILNIFIYVGICIAYLACACQPRR